MDGVGNRSLMRQPATINKGEKMTYYIYDRHINTNKIKTIEKFNSLEKARKQLAKFFAYDIEKFTTDELIRQAKIKLSDGKIIDFKEFCQLEEVKDYEYVLEGDSYDNDSHRYYIEEGE